MAENEQPTNPETTTGTPSSTPVPTTSEVWRAGPGSPFAGKTAEEIHGLAMGQAYALEQANQSLQRFNQPAHQPQSNSFDLDRELPDGQYAENEKVKDVIRRLAAQSSQSDPVARNLAAQAVYGNIRQSRAEDFKRWGTEIDNEIRKMDVSYWTYDSLNTIVNMVRANHLDELVAEKAKRFNEDAHTTIRSGTGGSGSGSHTHNLNLSSDGVPTSWATAAKAAGITEAEVQEFCTSVGISVEDYMKDLVRYGKGAVIRG